MEMAKKCYQIKAHGIKLFAFSKSVSDKMFCKIFRLSYLSWERVCEDVWIVSMTKMMIILFDN